MYYNRPRLLGAAENMECRLYRCLKVLTSSSSSSNSLHIIVYEEPHHRTRWEILRRLLTQFESAIPCTFEFFGLASYYNQEISIPLEIAYELQAVVHISSEPSFTHFPIRGRLAMSIDNIFGDEDVAAPVGQLFLCVLPRAVLTRWELASAHDTNEAALIKLSECVTVWPDLSGSPYETKLDFLKSRIKLVEPGFRPSLADLYPKPQAT